MGILPADNRFCYRVFEKKSQKRWGSFNSACHKALHMAMFPKVFSQSILSERFIRRCGSVVEHTLGKGEVEGSILSSGTIFYFIIFSTEQVFGEFARSISQTGVTPAIGRGPVFLANARI